MAADGTQFGLSRGALVQVDGDGVETRIEFQFNPASIRRRLTPGLVGGEPEGRSEDVRFSGSPVESLDVTIEIDGRPNASSVGVLPDLQTLNHMFP